MRENKSIQSPLILGAGSAEYENRRFGISLWSIVGTALLALLLISASAVRADANPVTIKISPDVENTIRRADPKTAARMKKAIQVSNKFVRLRFSNDDGYDPEIEEGWNKTVGPLIAMTGEQWFEWRDQRLPASSPIRLPDDFIKIISLMSCPAVTLSEIKVGNKGFSLVYRAILVGGFVEKFPGTPGKGGHQNWIDKTRSGQSYSLTFEVGSNDRITGELSTEKSLVFQYFYYRDDFSRNTKATGFVSEKFATTNRKLLYDLDSAASVCNSTAVKQNR
jgi:hypothetical protein